MESIWGAEVKTDERRDGRGHRGAGERGVKDLDVPAFYEA